MIKFRKLFDDLEEEFNLNTSQLAKAIGISLRSIYNIRSGNFTKLRDSTVLKISDTIKKVRDSKKNYEKNTYDFDKCLFIRPKKKNIYIQSLIKRNYIKK